MTASRHWFGALLAAILLPLGAWAQSIDPTGPFEGLRWLPSGSDLGDALTRVPRRVMADGHDPRDPDIRLGELAFRSPSLFGKTARRLGLSCQTCHPAGHATTGFFVPGLSDRPGNVDPINAEFHPDGDDSQFHPINIPSLRGIAATAPYGRDGRFATLEEFTRHVIVDEFGGAEPPGWLLDALLAYQRSLAPLEALTKPGRGADIFARACAGCHMPANAFTDGKQHDVGSGGHFDTPTLLNVTASAPYFHDGRYGDLAGVIDHFDRQLGLGLAADERADLLAFVEAIGATTDDMVPITLRDDLDRLTNGVDLLGTVIAAEEADQTVFVVRELRPQLGAIHARFPDTPALAAARTTFVAWSRTLQDIGQAAEAGDLVTARVLFKPLAAQIGDAMPGIAALEPATLYMPANLQAAMQTQ